MEEAVRFKVRDDHLFGILHTPEPDADINRHCGILFRTAGLRYRVGPYGQYVRFARRLCEEGYSVLRYDAPGIGDSEGSFSDLLEYRRLHAGNHEVTQQVIDFFIHKTGLSSLGVLGLCGGAYDALLTGASHSRVSFAVLLSLVLEQADGSIPVGMGEFDPQNGWDCFHDGADHALDTCLDRGKKIFFLYGERDPFFRAFQDRFYHKVLDSP